MGRSSDADRRHLEQHHGQWRVVVAVPRGLHGRLGTKLKRSLQTDSLAVANRLKWPVIAELKALISNASDDSGKNQLMQEAVEMARLRRLARDDHDIETIDIGIELRAEEIAGAPVGVGTDDDTGREEPILDPARARIAGHYITVARGEATPLDLHHAAYKASLSVKARTLADDDRALDYLTQWCRANHLRPAVEAITPKLAGRFMDDLASMTKGVSPVTLNKYLRRLSRYWQWMEKRHYAASNVWHRKTLEEPTSRGGEEERPFTDSEMVKLLEGDASPAMADLMRIGALTGARLDAIVCLSVGDCVDGFFRFKPQKKEKEARACPIHPVLLCIVASRSEGKDHSDPLFPEWPGPKKAGSMRERSFKASNQFTDYRRLVGVDEVIPGKRRSLVNFHSFRRWFITKAEQAGQPEHIIASVVGHKRQGMTLGRYSSGPLFEQARQCVEVVSLPTRQSLRIPARGLRETARGGQLA
ncbi:MAG: integrase [Bosea sp.]|nr:integrase [Bosea sp. (in: a-proteobacteria)]